MYEKKQIDPFTGMPVSKKTADAAKDMISAFNVIENIKSAIYSPLKGLIFVSDSILKYNISPIEDAVTKLNNINGYTYRWKDTLDIGQNTELTDYGVLAQEIERNFPSLVQINELGVKAVNYYKLIPILIEALKEQNVVISNYEERLKKLEEKMK